MQSLAASTAPPAWYYPRTLFDAPGTPDRPGGHIPQRFTSEEVEQFYLDRDGTTLSPPGDDLRMGLQDELLDSVATADLPTSPVLYLTGGVPGAGKSTILEELQQRRRDLLVIDPDRIKQRILADLSHHNPDLRSAIQNDSDWGSVVHWTSSVVATSMLQNALTSGHNIAFDSSMASDDPERFRQYADSATCQDYKVHALVTRVDPEVTIRRAADQARTPATIPLQDGSTLEVPGRQVPPDLIYETHGYLERNIRTYLQEGLYHRVTLLENNLDGVLPRVTTECIQTAAGYDRFTSTLLQPAGEQLSLFPELSNAPNTILTLD